MSGIVFNDVGKRYGAIEALRNVSFTISTGEIVAVLGPNGAGKTTAIELLLGLRPSSSGTILVESHAPQSIAARRLIGATPQATGFPDSLRVREVIAFVRAHYAAPLGSGDILQALDLTDLAGKRIGSLSGGQQRRVALALAFVGDCDIVVLDEPSTGLDVEARRRLWGQLRARAFEGKTVLFTTHYLEEAQSLATRIIVLDQGTIRFDGTPDDFQARFGKRRVEYVGEPIPAGCDAGVTVLRSGTRTIVTTSDTDAYIRALVRAEVPFSELRVAQSSFEEMFLTVTGASS